MTSTITDKLQTDIRLSNKDDLPFIISSWTICMKHVYPNQYALDFTQQYHEYLVGLIARSTIVVACLSDDASQIISYLVYSSFGHNQVVHYAYTKLDARRQGYVKELMRFSNPLGFPVVFTHPAKNANIMDHLSKHYIFDPTMVNLS